MKDLKRNLTELTKKCFEGEVTLTKVTLWLALTTCLLAGIVYGLRKAPMTHGMMIGCNNGNNNGNTCRRGIKKKKSDAKEEAQETASEENGN